MKTCGNCHFGKLNPKDMNMRICYGAPPIMILLPGPNGQTTLNNMHPTVRSVDPACALFEPKSLAEIAGDNPETEEETN